MTPRERQRADLLTARRRIDAQLARLATSPGDIPTDPPPVSMSVERARDFARHMIWHGSTHAEVAERLEIPVAAIPALIAAERDHVRRAS